MDIINSFMPFVGADPRKLHRFIENSPCLSIARKYAALSDELAKARLATLGSCTVSAKGDLKIESRPGMAELQTRISSLEARVGRLVEISKEYGVVLVSVGVTDPTSSEDDIGHRLEHLSLAAEIAPACWQLFILCHDRQPGILPGDLLKNEEYSAFEQDRKAIRDKALEGIAPLREAMQKLGALAEEAAGL